MIIKNMPQIQFPFSTRAKTNSKDKEHLVNILKKSQVYVENPKVFKKKTLSALREDLGYPNISIAKQKKTKQKNE